MWCLCGPQVAGATDYTASDDYSSSRKALQGRQLVQPGSPLVHYNCGTSRPRLLSDPPLDLGETPFLEVGLLGSRVPMGEKVMCLVLIELPI